VDRLKIQSDQDVFTQNGKFLPLMEEFYTIQGEGFNTVKAAYFIRVGGCDVGCHWCDVKESWDASIHPLTSADEIVNHANQFPGKAVVVTGGEPSMYPMDYLTAQLKSKGMQTFVETQLLIRSVEIGIGCAFRQKKTMKPLAENFKLAHELKVIIFNKHDFIWAEENAAQVNDKCILYLQPEWSKSKEITPLIIDYVMKNPKWNISLQTHKYLNIP
jgi:7-carboxy-7-deazaguanine synthase